MLEANFDTARSRAASVTGAVQYDTGQRLRLRGLPSPQELSERDDFLSGDSVTVQVQYAYRGDSQTEARVASYDEREGCWMAEVPNVYLTRSYEVLVYVYVGYGSDETGTRSKTLYTGSYRPEQRPAPSDKVTPDQGNAWDALVTEVNLSISQMNQVASAANAAAAEAAKWGNASVSARTLAPGSEATAELSEVGGVKHITYGIPRGAQGPQGPAGPQGPKGPAGVTFSLSGTTLTITTT